MTTVLILAWLATGLGLGYGWSRDHIRANKAVQREGVLRALYDGETARLRTMLASAEADRTNAETEAATYLRKLGEEAAARVMAEFAADDLRAQMLPDLNYLDTVANLPVGFRLDMEAFDSETPIGLSVLSDHIADVVPLRGGRA